ncbi:MAG: hypothetical protein LBT38_05655 [Deltaproteobacteria bacterium]|jgi:hypothetical protein|nr:hypothetical protein [Deltaproteobacteria bacterium]
MRLIENPSFNGEMTMKILPFDPNITPRRAQGSKAANLNFSEELAKANQPNSGLRAIFSENLKASQGVSPEDLGAAGQLVKDLIRQIQVAGPERLEKVHNLDGILYYYQV